MIFSLQITLKCSFLLYKNYIFVMYFLASTRSEKLSYMRWRNHGSVKELFDKYTWQIIIIIIIILLSIPPGHPNHRERSAGDHWEVSPTVLGEKNWGFQAGNPFQVEHCPFNCDSDFKIFKSRKEMLDLIQKGYLELQVVQYFHY